MKFVCMGFMNESKYETLSEAEGRRMMEECLAYDDELRRGGHFIGGEALQSARSAVTLRMKQGSVDVTDGPYAETKEMLGGILLLEARDLNHAIALMSQHPGVKLGPFEIRPADEATNRLIAARDAEMGNRPETTGERCRSKDTLREALSFSYEWIKPLADDLADSPVTSPTPGNGNHPLWVMGHLAYSSASLLSMITGRTQPYDSWSQLFAGGTTPLPDSTIYPPYTEVLAAYTATHLATLEILEELSDAQLEEKPLAVCQDFRNDPKFQTVRQVLLFVALHEMSHRGQLADARKTLGRQPFS